MNDNLPFNDVLSNIVVHFMFCSAFSGISMTVRPSSLARSLRPVKR